MGLVLLAGDAGNMPDVGFAWLTGDAGLVWRASDLDFGLDVGIALLARDARLARFWLSLDVGIRSYASESRDAVLNRLAPKI